MFWNNQCCYINIKYKKEEREKKRKEEREEYTYTRACYFSLLYSRYKDRK